MAVDGSYDLGVTVWKLLGMAKHYFRRPCFDKFKDLIVDLQAEMYGGGKWKDGKLGLRDAHQSLPN